MNRCKACGQQIGIWRKLNYNSLCNTCWEAMRKEVERQLKIRYPSVETKAEKKANRQIEQLLKMRATTELIALLGDPDLEMRLRALEALAKLADKRSVNPILNLLREVSLAMDPNQSVRKKAAEVLSQIGWHPESDEEKVFYWLAKDQRQLCADLGVHAIPIFLKAYKQGLIQEWVFSDFLKPSEYRFTTPDAIEPLIALLKDALTDEAPEAKRLRNAAMFNLMHIGEPVIEPLNRALLVAAKSGDERFENVALTILANLRKP